MNFPLRLLPFFASALLVFTPGLAAESVVTPGGLTAQEYVTTAERLYLDGKFAEAGAMFQKFLDDYGKSPEAAGAIRGIRFRHAMTFVHQKKFAEALEPLESALAQQPPLQTSELQELTFWLGVAHLEEKDFPAARDALEKFLAMFPPATLKNPASSAQYPAAMKIPEARLLIGSAWILEEKFAEAAAYYAALEGQLAPENRSRAVVLRLYSLLQDNQNDEAMRLVESEFPRLSDLAQLVTFQSLTLELGNRWLEAGEYRKAIFCLQRVWSSDRLLKHQEEKLEDLESRLKAAEADPRSDPYAKLLLGQLSQKVQREIDQFSKIPSFDAALRLRLATAYLAMGRHREAALILEDMLGRLPADPLVEKASLSLIQTWFEIERWPKVREAAAAFRKKFPTSASAPLSLYLEGLAAQKESAFDASLAALDAILEDHPDSDLAPRALFMKGFTLLLAERNAEAVAQFEKFPGQFPGHELAEAAAYWLGMGLSLDKQFDKARSAMDDYLKAHKSGAFAGSAHFRKAYCAQQMENYPSSIRELRAYLKNFPGHEHASEARILLGDALMNEGKMEEGLAVLKDIPSSDTRFYEEGVFKSAKALKLMEEYDRLLALMAGFQKTSPQSPRVAEAVSLAGWVFRQRNDPGQARKLYWDAIREHGSNPAVRSVDDLFPALARLYPKDEQEAYLALLGDLQRRAEKSGDNVLAMRTLWARGAALRKSKPEEARALFLRANALSNVQTTNPLLLADFAQALADSGDPGASAALFRDLIKWNPRAPQKDRALASIAFAALEKGDEEEAMKLFDRFQKEIVGSREAARILLARAALEEQRGRKAEAKASLEALLALETASGKEKSEALFRIGQIHLRGGKPALAIPYFQRIYVMHGRWRDWVAKAYLSSGEAFEKLKDTDSARRTYQELCLKEDLKDFQETSDARRRLEALGGPLTEDTPGNG